MNILNLQSKIYSFQQKRLEIDLPIYEVFKRIYSKHEAVFFLESLGELGIFSRYSIIGFAPENHIEARKNTIIIDGKKQKAQNPFWALQEINQVKIPQSSFCGGLVGYISYEGTRYFEPSINFKNNSAFPDFEFGLYLDGIIYDKKNKDFYYFFLTKDRSKQILQNITEPIELSPFSFKDLGANTTRTEYDQMIKDCLEQIHKGNCFQVVLAVQFDYEISGSPLFLYEQLREINPSPHMFFLKFGKRQLIGASPELVVRYQVDHTGLIGNRIENFPLAGTAKRSSIKEVDEKLRQEMLNNEKEKAEHMMLVDLGRNDIGKVCKFGTVKVPGFMTVKKYSHVQHIASEIEGEVRKDKGAFDCIAATSPMGTVSGAPKVEALKIISSLEKKPRGPYAGEIGYISFNGDCMFCVGLRSIFINDNKAYVGLGSGIVYDSIADYEYQEILRKGAGMKKALLEAQKKSVERTQKKYTLEELRNYLDRCGKKIFKVLSFAQFKKEINSLDKIHSKKISNKKKREWLAELFHKISAGLDDPLVKSHFTKISSESPEVMRILTGKHFHKTGLAEDRELALDDKKFAILRTFLDSERHELLEVLQERFYWIQHVAYFKKARGIDVRKIDREKQILADAEEKCREKNLPEKLGRLMYLFVILPIAFEIEDLIMNSS